ncbi:hypothetical protein FB561_4777 [Kribbella amoyensis]|uniref:DUF6458 domain-containing protein n=1 Tax=Kribbella amoyensis TaxID=996641 RepID=A0A561BXN5_9ACTN|nr:DUF6458 family protein [Kribbella amoyensis]TWD83611.1 hypothetical protein FB561_4777 [Kribbella amoyensis]
MRIGAGILLIALGGIIAFAIRDTSGPVNFTVVGIIIMLAGAAGMWLSYRLANQRGADEKPIIDPVVEDQYSTAPHEYPVEEPIDVTPTHLREESPRRF